MDNSRADIYILFDIPYGILSDFLSNIYSDILTIFPSSGVSNLTYLLTLSDILF